MQPGVMKCLRRIPKVVVLPALLGACFSEQPPPTALTSDVKYNDFRVLSDAEKRLIARGALSGFKDARIKWPQFPNSTESPVVYCALIGAKGSTAFKAQVILVTQGNHAIASAALDTADRGPDGAADFCQRKGINLADVTS
jgi:hypothetical protein